MSSAEQRLIETLYRIAKLDEITENPQEALDKALTLICIHLEATQGIIALRHPEDRALRVENTFGFSQLPSEPPMLAIRVAHNGEPFALETLELAAPLILGDSPVGVVYLAYTRSSKLPEDALRALCDLSAESTRLLSRLWQARQWRTKARHLESLIKAGQDLVSLHHLETILHNLLEEARRLLDCRLCAIFLLTKNPQRLRLEAISGADGKLDHGEELALSDSALGVAILRKKQVEVPDLARTEEHHFVSITQREGLVSLLCSPMVCSEEVIGLLGAYTDRPHRFNDDEKALLNALASLGAVAIQNARLYGRVFATEKNLRKNERLTTLGLISAEIAHEIRNPLTVIKLLLETLGLDYAKEDPRRQDLSIIKEKLIQLEALVGRVLNFGRSTEALHARYPIDALIEESLLLVRLKLEQSNIALHYTPSPSPLFVQVHKGQFQQVLLNLILNAIEAMPDGGEFQLCCHREQNAGEPWAIVEIRDTGPGIPEHIRERIFESFLSGKSTGTGLGLGIAKRILRSHHGDLTLLQTSSAGTIFECRLPAVD